MVKIFERNSAQGGHTRLHTSYELGRVIRSNCPCHVGVLWSCRCIRSASAATSSSRVHTTISACADISVCRRIKSRRLNVTTARPRSIEMNQLTRLRCNGFGEPVPGSPIETCCQQALALSDTVSIVQAQNRHCDSSFRGQRLDGCAFPGKVGRPSLGPWIKKGHQTSCLWIKRAHVGTFVSITETPHRLPGPVRTNVSYAANYGHTPQDGPHTCITGSLLHTPSCRGYKG